MTDVDVYALDLSLNMLKEERRADICVCGDMENLPFKDESFDRAFFLTSLHHVKNTERALREARRVIRSKGSVVLSEPTSLRLLLLGKEIESAGEGEFCFSVFYLLNAIREAGLQVVFRHHRGFFQRFLPTKSIVRLYRIANRLDNILNRIPLFSRVGVLGSSVTIVALKS
jgi:SAM-dependent methyltransferase